MKMATVAIIILSIFAINYVVTMVMNFLGVELQFYGSYLIWIIVLLIFWGVLPEPVNYFS